VANFFHVKAGDRVTRVMGGSIIMELLVTRVDDHLIHCGGGWTFDRETGIEEDEELGWGVRFGLTGSRLVPQEST
jgi:hypothetical protein